MKTFQTFLSYFTELSIGKNLKQNVLITLEESFNPLYNQKVLNFFLMLMKKNQKLNLDSLIMSLNLKITLINSLKRTFKTTTNSQSIKDKDLELS